MCDNNESQPSAGVEHRDGFDAVVQFPSVVQEDPTREPTSPGQCSTEAVGGIDQPGEPGTPPASKKRKRTSGGGRDRKSRYSRAIDLILELGTTCPKCRSVFFDE